MDPECSFLEAQEANFTSSQTVGTDVDGWMFPWDIAKLNGIMYDAENEKQAAFIEDLCEGCPSRSPPDHPKLAERGIKQW
eukprot:9808846-Lingulodinium_polyedra.AAC.1